MWEKTKLPRVISYFKTLGKPLYWAFLCLSLLGLSFFKLLYALGNTAGTLLDFHPKKFVRTYAHSRNRTEKILRRLLPSQQKTPTTVVFPAPNSNQLSTPPITPSMTVTPVKIFWFHRLWPRLSLFLLIPLLLAQGTLLLIEPVFTNLPTPQALAVHRSALTTTIYDRHGTVLYRIFKDENRSFIPLSSIPQHVIDATISMEDKEFYTHKGFSFKGIGRALRSIVTENKIQGGSTITQQLVKNTVLTNERTLLRKVREIVVSIQVERYFSKNQILEMYFNEVPYGGTVYGIQEASKAYFGKSANELTLAEGAYLSGITQAPSAYSAFGSTAELGINRMHEVIRRMLEDGKISPIQAEEALHAQLVFSPLKHDIKAPHFVMYIREVLERKYGKDMVSQGGLEITTTLDLTVQNQVQEIVSKEIAGLARLRVNNGAALVTNPKSGEIIAMVGSRDYYDLNNDGQVNVTTRPRQPGSSIKPLMYASAFERGLTPASLVDDAPITYSIPGSKPYSPKNYDGRYHGRITIRQALANSYNIPAVKTLASIGVSNFVAKAKQFGITSWDDSSRFGLSLTLGGGEVLLTDMATAYGTFANNGETVRLNGIVQVKDAKGKVLYANPCLDAALPCNGKRTLDPRIAYQVTNILMDNQARSPAFGPRSVLYIPDHQVAVKTGTTNNYRDNWTFGYTSDRLVGVWVGNNDNQPMSQVTSGITGASPIWNKIMTTFLDPTRIHTFTIPNDLVAVELCGRGGRLSCGQCQGGYTEYLLPGTQPTECTSPNNEEQQDTQTASRDQILEGIATQ